jgi:branched-chain amino acid aminotransferase
MAPTEEQRNGKPVCYVDGEFVPADQATLPLSDLAILRGYAVFDFLRTYNRRPFHLLDHIERMRNSARVIGLTCPWPSEEIASIVYQVLEYNELVECNLRLLVTGGDSEDSISPGDNPRLIVLASALNPYPRNWYDNGVAVITAPSGRDIAAAKSIDYIKAIITLRDARAAGAVESVYVDGNDCVLEGTTSNIFVVAGGILMTPDESILPGITRKVVLDLAGAEFSPLLTTITRHQLLSAEEVFLTSSNKEVLPVVTVDGAKINKGVPGPITRKIIELFGSYTQSYEA